MKNWTILLAGVIALAWTSATVQAGWSDWRFWRKGTDTCTTDHGCCDSDHSECVSVPTDGCCGEYTTSTTLSRHRLFDGRRLSQCGHWLRGVCGDSCCGVDLDSCSTVDDCCTTSCVPEMPVCLDFFPEECIEQGCCDLGGCASGGECRLGDLIQQSQQAYWSVRRRMAVTRIARCYRCDCEPAVLPALADALCDTDANVRLAAANGIASQLQRYGCCCSPCVQAKLEQAQSDCSWLVRRQVSRALRLCGCTDGGCLDETCTSCLDWSLSPQDMQEQHEPALLSPGARQPLSNEVRLPVERPTSEMTAEERREALFSEAASQGSPRGLRNPFSLRQRLQGDENRYHNREDAPTPPDVPSAARSYVPEQESVEFRMPRRIFKNNPGSVGEEEFGIR